MSPPPVLSVSQVEKFDPEQGGCPTRWWFEDVRGFRQGDSAASEDGQQGHRLLAEALRSGVRPGRVRLGKAVNAVIDSGVLSAGSRVDLQVEARFSGQQHYDAAGQWIRVDASRTLWHAGHPWDGFIDLRWRSGSTATVWDHKFSSDIHARALPAEKLIRTVQMPIYALDSLRAWPEAETFNLIHLYVSRRGQESFIRQQQVTVEQVRVRAEEITGLVRQMDTARAATRQEDVPYNRGACLARTGCPHQFRCNAFRRKTTMMSLTKEEELLFGVLGAAVLKPAQVSEPLSVVGTGVVTLPLVVPATASEPLERPNAGRVTPPADVDLDGIFDDVVPPAASTPKPQPAPTREACGAVPAPENSSRLKGGELKHIGCPADARVPEPAKLSPRAAQETSGPRCESCPHPAHAGKPCGEKRGRGSCRCGAAVEQPQRPTPAPAPTFEEVEAAAGVGGSTNPEALSTDEREAGQRARAAEPSPDDYQSAYMRADRAEVELSRAQDRGAELERELDTAKRCVGDLEQQLRRTGAEPLGVLGVEASRLRATGTTLDSAIATGVELSSKLLAQQTGVPTGTWSGTLAVNVTVELGPSTLAFLAGLVKR